MLICGQFIAKDMNLWSTLLFVRFEKLFFSDFWGPLNLLGPSKKTQLLDSWPLSMHQKTRPWISHFKNIVLYLMVREQSLWIFALLLRFFVQHQCPQHQLQGFQHIYRPNSKRLGQLCVSVIKHEVWKSVKINVAFLYIISLYHFNEHFHEVCTLKSLL